MDGRRDDRLAAFVAGDPSLGLPTEDLAARVVVAYLREIVYRYADARQAPEDELEALFTRILREAAEHGEITDLRHEGPNDDAAG